MGISIIIGNYIGRFRSKAKEVLNGVYFTKDEYDYCTKDGAYYITKSSSVFNRGYWDFNGIWNNKDIFKY